MEAVAVKHMRVQTLSFSAEKYGNQTLSRARHSFLVQLILWVLPPEIETGRLAPIFDKYIKMNRERHQSKHMYTSCKLNVCEDEMYFLMICI